MMHIAFCTDTNYVMPCGVAMVSICENNKDEEITFHLVVTDEGTAPDEVERKVQPLNDIADKYNKQTKVYRMDAEKIKKFVCSGSNYISTTAFSRIFLPEILSKDIKKVLYLDCDLVCDGSLKDLWEIELEKDCPLGAVVDCDYASVSNHLRAQTPKSVFYCNSGVLLMNLDCWRRKNYVDLATKTAIEKKFSLLDQDVLNHIFAGKIKYLPVKYNVLLVYILDGLEHCHLSLDYYFEIVEACKNPVIVHYLSPNKPWKNECCPLREIWDKYVQMTIWKDYQPVPVSTTLHRTYIYKDLIDIYWYDNILFKESIAPYLRFFKALVKLKNKRFFVRISSLFFNSFANFLEKAYEWKTK